MYKTIIILSIILQFALAHGTIFKGSLINNTSGLPVASAEVSFRIGTQLPYPVTHTDIIGTFVADLAVPDNYPMQIFIEASGFKSERVEITVSDDTIDVGIITLEEIIQEQIRLIGTVIDSLTKLPVSGAKIQITKIKGAFIPDLQFYADTAGAFCHNVEITNDYYYVCTVSDSGYYPTSFNVTKAEDSVHQAVHLRPEGSIRLSVNGQVVDAKTGRPVNNARVILGTNFHDATPDTFFTSSNGIFIRSVEAGITSSAVPALYCNISAEGYIWYSERVFIVGIYTVNLAEIKLVSTGSENEVHVFPKKFNASPVTKNVNTSITLNGRLINGNKGIRAMNDCSSQLFLKVQQNSSGKKVAQRSNSLR